MTQQTSLALSILPHPCNSLGGSVLTTCAPECNGGGGTGSACTFTADQLAIFNTIKNSYADPLANGQYQNIPCDLVMYLNLLDALTKTKQDSCYSSNGDVMLLISIVEDALKGAVNAYGLNVDVVRLTIDNKYLHEVIHEYMSGKNMIKTAFNAEGGFSLLKTFDLAPLFKYYICIYGLPPPGQGFDLGLLKIVYDSLVSGGIDPGVDNFQCIPAPNDCTANKVIVDLYHRLSVLMDSFKAMNQMYYSGQVAILQTLFTQSVFEALASQLEALSIGNIIPGATSATQQIYAEYENIRYYVAVSLGSLNIAVRQYDTLVKAQDQIATDAEKLAILLDPVKLKQYALDFLSKSRTLLPDQHIQAPAGRLKPHYARYVELYGFPTAGSFDPDKLAIIKRELGMV